MASYFDRVAGDGMPFTAAYFPRHHLLEVACVAAVAYLVATWAIASRASARTRARVLVAELAVAVTGATAYVIYHRSHEPPSIFVWDAMERVTAYHQQLAVPALIALFGAPVMLIVAARPTIGRITTRGSGTGQGSGILAPCCSRSEMCMVARTSCGCC